MNKIIFLILSFFVFPVFGQNQQRNLEKYWYYRDRLKEKYIFLSPNNEEGSNIPIEVFGLFKQDETSLEELLFYFGDGNGSLQYYIGMLATEYRLLKDYGHDYSQTFNELVYALRAFERIDLTTESTFRSNYQIEEGDLNGFYQNKNI